MDGIVPITTENSFNEMLEIEENMHYIDDFTLPVGHEESIPDPEVLFNNDHKLQLPISETSSNDDQLENEEDELDMENKENIYIEHQEVQLNFNDLQPLRDRNDRHLSCPNCKTSIHSKIELKKHRKDCVGESSVKNRRVRYKREEYQCSECQYTCTVQNAFLRHLRQHYLGFDVPLLFSCVVCGKDHKSYADISAHMIIHREDPFFCCDLCPFRTVQQKKLIQHRRMHTGERPHLCPYCTYRSARRDNLRSHVRRVHNVPNLNRDTFTPE